MKEFNFIITLFLFLLSNDEVESKYKKFKKNLDLESPVGPPYPITASFFRDRYSLQEWNTTLTQFKKQGGDTVFLRAPSVSKGWQNGGNFQWCNQCLTDAKNDMKKLGLNISDVLTYEYEEGFSDAIMRCPTVDRKIISSRIYHRIVLPTNTTGMKSSCDFPKGSDVVVLFTSFSGIDPHQVLIESAANHSISVYLGIPKAPTKFSPTLMIAYYAWVDRVLSEHKSRYSVKKIKSSRQRTKSLYDTIAGYYSADDCDLPTVASQKIQAPPSAELIYLDMYTELGGLVHNVGKKFAISPSVNTNRLMTNGTLENNVQGFEDLAKTKAIDIIAVREGRGSGKGGYFWPVQLHKPIQETDDVLDKILHLQKPKLHPNITFSQVFQASNQAVFKALQQSQEQLQQSNISFHFWLNIEAYESLHDDPCLPVDTHNSGNGEMMNRATKARVDWGLSAAGTKVQKVLSFAWDSDFTCTTQKFNTSLKDEIQSDINRPILGECRFHSMYNLSVVVIGFNIMYANVYTVNWTDTSNTTRTNQLSGYYFELDYGAEHNLVGSIQYTMLYDISNMNLTPKGTIHVTSQNSLNDCYFDYDLSNGIIG